VTDIHVGFAEEVLVAILEVQVSSLDEKSKPKDVDQPENE
jgi:hypothetical protein